MSGVRFSPKPLSLFVSPITDANNPTQDFSNNYRNPETQVNHYYSTLTSRLLNDFYPKFCPKCGIKCSKTVSTRPDLIRCHKCHYLTSRLSGTLWPSPEKVDTNLGKRKKDFDLDSSANHNLKKSIIARIH